MRPLRIIALVLGILFALAGVVSVTSGGFVLGIHRFHAASSGFFVTPSQTVGSNGFALTAPDINGQLVGEWERWALAQAGATVRLTGSSKLAAPVFMGVAPTERVSEYLSGVSRDRIQSVDLAAGSVEYDHVDGTSLPDPPEEQSFWVAKVAGTGSQTLEWALREGDWAVVIMNGDASAPVVADVTLAARFGITDSLIVGLTALGVVLLAVGAALTVFGARRTTTRLSPRASSRLPQESGVPRSVL
jgi:hypothetical protein